jgi:hypothetical protein
MKSLSILAAVVILEIAVAVTLIPLTTPARLQTTDFVNFYVGAWIVRQGDGANLYRRDTQDAAFQSVLGYKSNQYFLHPPFEAAALAPLTRLSLEQGFVVWMLINVALLGLLPLILMPCMPLVYRKPYLVLLGFCFLPALIALNLGQDSILLLFVLSASYLLMAKQREFAAGLVLALAAIKFQYLLILIPLLLVSRKFRLVAAFTLGCGLLGLVSSFITGPRGLLEYFHFLRSFDAHAGYGGLNPSLMVNARGFLAGLGYKEHWFAYASAIGILLFGLGVAGAIIGRKKEKAGMAFALFLVIAVAAAPYAHFPDATVLLLPVIIATDYVAMAGIRTLRRKLIAVCCASMFLWPYALLLSGGHYWWNSRIYLVFPLIVMFAVSLATELCSNESMLAAAREVPA